VSVYSAITLKRAARVFTPCDSSACARTELAQATLAAQAGRAGILAAERILLSPA
jgi:hypothetical protein